MELNKTAHFIMQSKGGAGKSVCSAILAQYLNEKTEGNLSLIDTDPSNKTLGSYQGLNVQMVDVIGSNKLVDQSKFDNFINDFKTCPLERSNGHHDHYTYQCRHRKFTDYWCTN